MLLTPADQVIMTNHTDKDWRGRYDGKLYACPAGASVHIPFVLMKKDFGDPRSGVAERVALIDNQRVRLPSRSDEVERLQIKYGVAARILSANTAGQDPSEITLRNAVPNCTFTTVEGERILSVVEDEGGDDPMVIPVDLDTPEAIHARVEQMQKDLDVLMAQSKAIEQAPVDANEDVPTDGPAAGRRSKEEVATPA